MEAAKKEVYYRFASYKVQKNLPLHQVSFQLGRINHLQPESILNRFQIILELACYCLENPSTDIAHSHLLAASHSCFHCLIFSILFMKNSQLREFSFHLSRLMLVNFRLFCEILEFKFEEYFLRAQLIFKTVTFLVKDAYLLSILFFCRRRRKLVFKWINIHKRK